QQSRVFLAEPVFERDLSTQRTGLSLTCRGLGLRQALSDLLGLGLVRLLNLVELRRLRLQLGVVRELRPLAVQPVLQHPVELFLRRDRLESAVSGWRAPAVVAALTGRIRALGAHDVPPLTAR